MLQAQSSLLALASEFTGKVSPYQSVLLEPHPDGGVIAAATNKGHISAVLHDPAGRASRRYVLLPSAELIRAARPIKSADRQIAIEEGSRLIGVTTYRKTTPPAVQRFPLLESPTAFPPLDQAIAALINQWDSATAAGALRVDAALMAKAIGALGAAGDSLLIGGLAGGPLRLESEALAITIVLMPQSAEPLPPLPNWLRRWAHTP